MQFSLVGFAAVDQSDIAARTHLWSSSSFLFQCKDTVLQNARSAKLIQMKLLISDNVVCQPTYWEHLPYLLGKRRNPREEKSWHVIEHNTRSRIENDITPHAYLCVV